jgi:hypothetical protein
MQDEPQSVRGPDWATLVCFGFFFSPARFCSEEISENQDQRSDVKKR